jgi:hypothetical protein
MEVAHHISLIQDRVKEDPTNASIAELRGQRQSMWSEIEQSERYIQSDVAGSPICPRELDQDPPPSLPDDVGSFPPLVGHSGPKYGRHHCHSEMTDPTFATFASFDNTESPKTIAETGTVPLQTVYNWKKRNADDPKWRHNSWVDQDVWR